MHEIIHTFINIFPLSFSVADEFLNFKISILINQQTRYDSNEKK
jgi:hypothetical protein